MTRPMLALAATVLAATAATAEDKEVKLSVQFGTPSPSWKASISEVRVVGKELWVKVDVASAAGIAPAVLGKAKAEATVKAPELPVKYVVFGKTWGWKNEEKGIVFVKDLEAKDAEKLETEWKGGKVVFEAKKGEK